jgi:hypothetical protein
VKIQRIGRKATEIFPLSLESIFISTEKHKISPAVQEHGGYIKACWGVKGVNEEGFKKGRAERKGKEKAKLQRQRQTDISFN